MRLISSLAILGLALAMTNAQDSDSAGPVGPISTNNGVSACVEYGNCTNGQSYASTETQQSPVKPPASSIAYAPPSNAPESSASVSNLAQTGAAAAFSSRVANGQGSGNAPDGATSSVDTAKVIAGSAPASQPSVDQSGSKDAAIGPVLYVTNGAYFWTFAAAFAGLAAGGAIIL